MPKPLKQTIAKQPPDPELALVDRIDFSPDNILHAAAEQPKLLYNAVDLRVQCMRLRTAAASRLERTEAGVELYLRSEARKSDEKLTEGHIKARLITNVQVQDAKDELTQAELREERAKGLVEAFRHRRDVIRVIGELTISELGKQRAGEVGEEQLTKLKDRLRGRYSDEE